MKLVSLLPFMENEEIKDLAHKIINGEVKGVKLVVLFPFLEEKDLDEIVDILIEKGDIKSLKYTFPFVSQTTIEKIYNKVKDGTIKDMRTQSLLPFLGKQQIKDLFEALVKEAANNPDIASDDDLDDDDLDDLDDDFE